MVQCYRSRECHNSLLRRTCKSAVDEPLSSSSGSRPLHCISDLGLRNTTLRRPADLVLLHDNWRSGLRPPVHWRTHLPIDLICHVRTGNVNDTARLARFLRGTANTLVLSAGGARGFAHLGVIRALREAHIPIDLIGGCSMGSIVGAAVALEWDDAEIKERLRHSFVNTNPVNDYRCRSFP